MLGHMAVHLAAAKEKLMLCAHQRSIKHISYYKEDKVTKTQKD